MANEQNLKPFNTLTESEQREIKRKGGKASGKKRRQRKAMKDQMEMLLALPFNLKDRNGQEVSKMLTQLGIPKKDIDNQMAMIISLWKTAIENGNQKIQAIQEIRKIIQDDQTKANDDNVQIINDLPQEDDKI